MQSILTHPKMTVIEPCAYPNASNAQEIQEELVTALSSGRSSTVLVDMTQVETLDSSGLVALVSALTLAQQLNKRFCVCGVSPSIRIIFELTQLDRVFEIFDVHPLFEAIAEAAVA